MKKIRIKILKLFSTWFLLLILIGFSIPGLNEPTTHDPFVKSRDNIKSSDLIPEEIFQSIHFINTENIERIYDWGDYSDSNIYFDVPYNYNNSWANISLNILNSTINEISIETSEDVATRDEQSQEFILAEKSIIMNFSIYVAGLKDYQVNMEIRNQSYNGSSLYNFSYNLIGNGWLNMSFDQNLVLEAGNYYFYMEGIPKSNQKGWCRSSIGDNDTETWINLEGTWVLANFDLTLKVYASNIISPSDVDLKINNSPVINTGLGAGYFFYNGTINNNITSLNVTSNSSIQFNYMISAKFSRISESPFSCNLYSQTINWTIIPDLFNPGGAYENYTVEFSGIQPDYFDLIVYWNETVLSYSFSDINTIEFSQMSDKITFKSPNYIADLVAPEIVFGGEQVPITINTLDAGNLLIEIRKNDSELVYSNSTPCDLSEIIYWDVDPFLQHSNLSLEVHYWDGNEVGYYSKTIEFRRDASFISNTISAQVLEVLPLECTYFDPYQNSTISDASVFYELRGVTGEMEFNDQLNGKYTGNFDLNFHQLRPGNYTVTYSAQKDGFKSKEIISNIILEPREVDITLSKSTSTVRPGETVIFKITLKDKKTGGILLYPIDLEFKIIQNTNESIESIVVNEELFGLTQSVDYKWIIPNNIGEGDYDIKIEVKSEFYLGEELLLKSLNIPKPIIWWIYLLIGLGTIISGSGTFIFTQKVRTKRSISGILLLHKSGIPLAQEMSQDVLKYDPMLFSSAIVGVITLIKEITGEKLHTMEIEGGFLNILKGENSWLVVILRKNPFWIKNVMQKCFDEIINDHGSEIEGFTGVFFDIYLNEYVNSFFGVSLLPENPKTEKELERHQKNQNLKTKGFLNAIRRSLKIMQAKLKELPEKISKKRSTEKIDS